MDELDLTFLDTSAFYFEVSYLPAPSGTVEFSLKGNYERCLQDICESKAGVPLKTLVNMHGIGAIWNSGSEWDTILKRTYEAVSSKTQVDLYNKARGLVKSTKDSLMLAAIIERQSFDVASSKGSTNVEINQTVNNVNILAKLEQQIGTLSPDLILRALLGAPVENVLEGGLVGKTEAVTPLAARLSAFNI